MMIGLQSLKQGLRAIRVSAAFMAVVFAASVGVSGSVSALNNDGNNGGPGPKYFDVDKDSPQSVCYKQTGPGWKKLGFKNLDHCLRYVSTPAPEVKSDCNGGWWYVYGFNSIGHCKLWVSLHGGGGYDGDDHPEDQY